MKTAFILLSLAFAVACAGMWVVTQETAMLHRSFPFPDQNEGGGKLSQGSFEIFCIEKSSWLPFLGIPAVGYAFFMSLRGNATIGSFCVFASVLAVAFVLLFFAVIIGCLIGWVPLYD